MCLLRLRLHIERQQAGRVNPFALLLPAAPLRRGEKGPTVWSINSSPENLKRSKVGDLVVITATTTAAITVEEKPAE